MRAAAAAPLIRWRLQRRSLRSVVQALQKRPRQPVSTADAARHVAVLVEKTLNRMPATHTCLVRSLVVWWLVGGDDVAEIRFGVAPPQHGEVPTFHAWVELGGSPINDAEDVAERFLPLAAPAPKPDQFD